MLTSGRGTYKASEAICSALIGYVHRVNKLITVEPLKSRYLGDNGDVVIGRVCEIMNKKWKIDIQGYDYAYLHINSIMLEDIQVD